MTNEEYIKAIEMRHSRRSYKNQKLSDEIKNVIKTMVDAVNENEGIRFRFIEDPTKAFTIFTGSFCAIAICADDTAKAREDCGYYGESIVLQCVYHGLGTCWVSGTYNENKILEILDLPRDERLYGLITIGYAKDKYSIKEKTMYNATHKTNRPYPKMFETCDSELPEAYKYGLKLVEMGPSAVNRRPVKFRYENSVLAAHVEEPYSDKSLDFGIAKLHFQIGCLAKGVSGHWTFENTFEEDKKAKIVNMEEYKEGKENE